MNIDPELDRLLTTALDAIVDGDTVKAAEAIAAARQRAEAWGATVETIRED